MGYHVLSHIIEVISRNKITKVETRIFNSDTYSIKQPDLYYFETIKMTSQVWSNFVWRIQATGEYSL